MNEYKKLQIANNNDNDDNIELLHLNNDDDNDDHIELLHLDNNNDNDDNIELLHLNNNISDDIEFINSNEENYCHKLCLKFSSKGQYMYDIFIISYPVIISYFLQLSLSTISIIFIGHMDDSRKLASVALGTMFSNCTGYAVCFGLASAVDTLASQAYGANAYREVGIVIRKAIIFLTLCMIPIIVLWMFTEQILLATGQEKDLAHMAGKFVQRLIPGLWPIVCFEVVKKYCQAMKIVKLFMIVGSCVALFHILMCYLLVFKFQYGIYGAATSMVISQWLLLIISVFIIILMKYHEETWCFDDISYSKDIFFRDWWVMIRLALHGCIMLCFEWWCFEVCALAAARLGAIQLDAFVINLNILSLAFMLPLGIAIGCSTLIGNALGANKPEEAKKISKTAMLIYSFTTSIVCILLFVARRPIGYAFSKDSEVVDSVERIIPLLCILIIFDHLQGVLSGILRGTAQQSKGSITNLLGYYVIAIPIGFSLAFLTSLKLYGLFLGLILGVVFTSSVYLYIIFIRTDWKKCAETALERCTNEESKISKISEEEI